MDAYTVLALLSQAVRLIVFSLVAVIAVGCLLDWLVRTRRINPFGQAAKTIRRIFDPIIAPMERRIVRAGGLPSSAAIWTLAAAVVIGIVLVSVFNFLAGSLITMIIAASSGPAGLLAMLVHATFGILRIAIIIVVIVSWLPISPFSLWVRWAFVVTEPILRPLRQIVPRLGMFDITPIVAYFALGILEWAILRL